MAVTDAVSRITDLPELDPIAKGLSTAVHAAYAAAGPAGQSVKNALHGVGLRHPLHPALTDLPIGAWSTALVLDAIAAARNDDGLRRAADVAIGIGLIGAAGAAITGLTDWSETDGRARRTGLVHGLLNIAATAVYATGYALRKGGPRAVGQLFTLAGYGIALGAAWLGGDLVYRQRIGVTHAELEEPDTFTAVAKSSDVPDESMKRIRHDDLDLLLVRQGGRLCALAHACTHAGGPLSEGTLKEGAVVCPWHGSEFALGDGRVINGPATQDQPCLAVREREDRIEVRKASTRG